MVEIITHGGKEILAKDVDVDYYIEWEFTCMSKVCGYVFRKPAKTHNVRCPKCQSINLIWVSKRSCDTLIDQDEIIVPPEDSPLM